jgi:magnesium-transporting ATPase (P-type)
VSVDGGSQDPLFRGLSEKEAAARLKAEGPNTLPQADRRTFTRIVLEIQFKVLGQQKIKHGTLIKTQIIKSNGEPVDVNYVVHDNDIAWQIRDIYLSGAISELATHRSEFAATLRTSGIDGLIDSLNKKADELQS